jgi:hypothetical protein
MDYCSIVWGGSPHVKKINLAQKRAARVILDITDNRYPSKDMFLALNWMPIEDRIKYRKAIMVYNYLCPDYMQICLGLSDKFIQRQPDQALQMICICLQENINRYIQIRLDTVV